MPLFVNKSEGSERGIKGLGQPLKSFRDDPKYFRESINKKYLESLGELTIPKKT